MIHLINIKIIRIAIQKKIGQSLIDLCCTLDIHTVNGRLLRDIDGNFTCTSNEGKSVVDFFLLSSALFTCL